VQGNGPSNTPASPEMADSFAFASAATNLVSGDTNGATDVFIGTGCSASPNAVSVSSTGAQATERPGSARASPPSPPTAGTSLSAPNATNLGATNGFSHVYVRDRYLRRRRSSA